MSHHPSLPQPPNISPNPSFFDWLRHHALLFVGQIVGLISATVSLIYYILGVYEHTKRDGVSEVPKVEALNHHLLLWSDCGHLVFIFLFICVLIYVLDDNDRGRYHARKVQERVFNEELTQQEQEALLDAGQAQVAQFKRYFLSFWVFMFFLYLAFLGKHVASSGNELRVTSLVDLITTSAFPFFTFALNNISLWCIFLCFTILYLPARDEESTHTRNRMLRFSIFGLSILVLSFPLVILSESSRIISSQGSNLLNYFTYFDTISGIINAIVVAMLIARLDSKLIGLRSWLILILYSYSAVQPLFAVFEQKAPVFQQIQTLVLIAVFILKVYFFLIIYYTLQTGRMLNYLFCFPILNRLSDAIFENQFEIKVVQANSFTFFITDDDKPAYATDKSFESRQDCARHIETLREAAKHKEAYDPKEKFGTHWVEIVAYGAALCHSIDLRSAQEVDELIEKSIQKLPYCKYVQWMTRSV